MRTKIFYFVFLISLALPVILSAQYVWRHKACLPIAGCCNQASFAVGNKIYSVGGSIEGVGNVGDVWEYDPTTDTWSQKNNFPSARNGATPFVINDTAYVCLGLGTTYFSDCYRYEQASDTWTQMASFPGAARYTAMCFVINQKAYVGCGHNAGQNNDFYEYDPITNTWTQKANFPGAPRQSGFGETIDTFGYMGLGGASVEYSDSYRYDAYSNTWTAIANFPAGPPDGPGHFVLNDTLYIVSGDDFQVAVYTYCYRYDVASDTWVVAPDYSCIAPGRFNAAPGFSLNGHGYVLGGINAIGSVWYNDLLEFGPPDTTFATLTHILGNDTTYCGNFTRVLSTGDSCTEWSTGIISSQITVSAPGSYWAFYDNGCGISIDTIHISQSPSPTVNLGNDTTTCGSQAVQLDAGNVGSTYNWSSGAHTQIIYPTTSGNYSVTVTNTSGCYASASVTINSDSIELTTSQVKVSCGTNNGSANALVFSGSSPFKYMWNNADTTNVISNLGGGNYTVTITDAAGCTATGTVTVNATSAPVLSLSNDTSLCHSPFTIILNAGNSDTSYRWNTSATTPTITVSNAGTYSVTASNGPGCSVTGSVVVNADDVQLSATDINASCSLNNGSVTAHVSGTAPFRYIWNNADTTSIISNLAAGTYSVTITDAAGCTATSTATIIAAGPPSVSVSALQTNVCPGDTAFICASPSGFAAYEWNTGDTGACIQTTYGGNYYVTAYEAVNCSAVSDQVNISIIQPLPVTVSVEGDTMTCYQAVSYQWYFNGNILPGDTSNILIAPQSGIYEVRTLESNGCYATSSGIPVIAGINNLQDDGLVTLYPNPTSGNIIVKFGKPISAGTEYRITTVDGQIVEHGAVVENRFLIPTDAITDGIYLLQIIDPSGGLFTKRFVVFKAK